MQGEMPEGMMHPFLHISPSQDLLLVGASSPSLLKAYRINLATRTCSLVLSSEGSRMARQGFCGVQVGEDRFLLLGGRHKQGQPQHGEKPALLLDLEAGTVSEVGVDSKEEWVVYGSATNIGDAVLILGGQPYRLFHSRSTWPLWGQAQSADSLQVLIW